ncbi:MAG: aspartyl/glutamyl-tRNA amidotransferase subunit A [Candidatus Woykebacteria bacterium RBG_16_43_9]|uniref:Glutamyl-tRNA(Gln) amidotransferase subunit A n=1 Tax=Candidatus Woykebacteria bacterium RBG_16_43_9 TaxID=1802596 RepID=A0A1G1WGL1_9BACT|nr:MAG: aspartyl/glutamyl-tRNA amidotransferase subunit A [Candidatus Woykebacteria bacterium RBG_16_43_9]
MDLTKFTVKEASQSLQNRKVSSQELTRVVFTQIEKLEPKLDAFLTITKETAEKQSRKIDKLIAENQKVNPLAGIPMALKDVIVTKGIKTTAGSKILSDFIPPYSATVYEKLENSGAVLVGKTNLDEFAMGGSTENSAYKPTKNPWDNSRVPGGSSGGSAASVAADMLFYSLGSDTGGSIRQPASFCGVVGMKPTYGRVSRYGLIAMASSLDQVGPITKTVEDAALVMNVISGYDANDATSVEKTVPDYTRFLTGNIKGVRIGAPKEFFGKGVDNQVKETITRAIKRLENFGAHVVDLSLPRLEEAIAVYYLIMPSEVSANLARYDGVRFGKARENFGPEVKRRIMLGTYALSSGYYDAYYLKAAKVRTLISKEFQETFKKVDVIVGPTSPVLPFKLGERVDDPLQMYLADILTVPTNLAGLPGISIPCGLARLPSPDGEASGGQVSGLPVGLQIIANHWQEKNIFNVAHAYEQNFPFTQKPKL